MQVGEVRDVIKTYTADFVKDPATAQHMKKLLAIFATGRSADRFLGEAARHHGYLKMKDAQATQGKLEE